uniref:Beta-defensin n=1 Tax=Canis lupus familiaris TaxID=9615 RepID=A0A8I3S628_CANLF
SYFEQKSKAVQFLSVGLSPNWGTNRLSKMDGRCEVECLSFEDKIGGCRAELTPLCCKKRKNN